MYVLPLGLKMLRWFKVTKLQIKIWIIIILIAFIAEMCTVPKLFLDRLKHGKSKDRKPPQPPSDVPIVQDPSNITDGYSVGTYYSNWSPYKARNYKPSDLPFDSLTHVYYAFFAVNGRTGEIQPNDNWSDFELPMSKGVKGCIKELQKIKIESNHNFKTILSVGGWSNREAFKKISNSDDKVKTFVRSTVENMFKYGFDGIDLDWEFPEEDTDEPLVYLDMMKGIRKEMADLEERIFGPDDATGAHAHFQLSVATPAFEEKLNIMPISEMANYIDVWNMMCYDYHGEWSDLTGYHSNLYASHHSHKRNIKDRSTNATFSADAAIRIMIEKYNVPATRISLGMAAYGRGFTNVKTNDNNFLGKKYHGVGGESEGEPGIWLYNQLPIEGTTEEFDSKAVSAYCFDPKSKTFVGYDNVRSMSYKGKYIKDMNLQGGFWWESCGDSRSAERSLVNAFVKEVEPSNSFVSMFKNPKVREYHLQTYPKDYLTDLFK